MYLTLHQNVSHNTLCDDHINSFCNLVVIKKVHEINLKCFNSLQVYTVPGLSPIGQNASL